jgi:hypothetical protein
MITSTLLRQGLIPSSAQNMLPRFGIAPFFFFLVKYPKQRDMNRAPTSLYALLDHEIIQRKIPFRLLLRENQNTRYL